MDGRLNRRNIAGFSFLQRSVDEVFVFSKDFKFEGQGGQGGGWLLRLAPDQAVQVRALAGTMPCCLGKYALFSY